MSGTSALSIVGRLTGAEACYQRRASANRAHWDGDTLVVNTIDFSNAGFRGSTDNLRLTEKFTRTAEDTLEYYLTIDAPTMWSRPWTLMMPLKKTGEKMFEFACHEGNYGLRAILSGARAQEQSTR